MKLLKKLVAGCAIAAGLVGGLAETVNAGSYAGAALTCNAPSLGNRICVDISANKIWVYSGAYTVYAQEPISGPLVAVGALPTNGWVASDSECQATGTGTSQTITFTTGGLYGLGGNTVTIFEAVGGGSWNHSWNNVPVTTNMKNIVAWMANSNTGYECMIVP